MAHSISAMKRIRQTAKRTSTNRIKRTAIKTAVKKVMSSVAGGNAEQAKAQLREAAKKLDKAAKAGVIHANKASRKKAQISRALARLNK